MLRFRDFGVFVFEFWVLRFRDLGVFVFDLGCFVFEFWVLRFRSRVLRFRDLGASCFGLRFRVLSFRNYRGFCDIRNNKGRGKCYQPSRRLGMITLTETLIIKDITETESNIIVLLYSPLFFREIV